MLCSRCREREALTDEKLSRLVKAGAPLPSLPRDLCIQCALHDPLLRKSVLEWAGQMRTWSRGRMAESFQRLRELAVRPLEAIDQFVDSLR